MPAISYVSGGNWWSAARMNGLFSEFDRRLTKALAGKTPCLLMGWGVGTQMLAGNLPISTGRDGDTGLPIMVPGIGSPTGFLDGIPAFGTVYAFKGSQAPNIYFTQTTPWDQGAFDLWAAALPESSRDATTKTIKVTTPLTNPPYALDWSLKANSRTVNSEPYYLWDDLLPDTSNRALRRHQYALAELVCEGVDHLTVPLAWDRYSCFRVHNLSGIVMSVDVESDTGVHTLTVPKFGVRSFRRATGYFDASLTYCFKYRAGKDRRFYLPLAGGFPEGSAIANNLMRPQIVFDWFSALGGERDPGVAAPNEFHRYGGTFADANQTATLVGDLIVHPGELRAVGWIAAAPHNEVRVGAFKTHATLAADLLPLGIQVAIAGNTATLTRAADAPGLPTSGLDVFAPGTNLLWCPEQFVSAPGSVTDFVAQRVRQYTPLPVTLLPTVELGVPSTYINQIATGTNSGLEPGAWGDLQSPTYTWESGGYINPLVAGRFATVGATEALLAGPVPNQIGDWLLTPEGWAVPSVFTHTMTYAFTQAANGAILDLNFWEVGLYGTLSGSTITRPWLVPLLGPGWSSLRSPNLFSPLQERRFGELIGGSNWTTKNWTGQPAQPDGGEPVAIEKDFVAYPGLKYLSNPGPPSGTVDAVHASRYGVYLESDEARSAQAAYRSDWRVKYAQGHVYPDLSLYWRRPMQVEDFNHLAWVVNAWTRFRPVMDLSRVWLRRATGVGTDPAGIDTDVGGAPPRSGIYPADAYRIVDPADVAAYQAMGVTVSTEAAAQGWTAGAAAYRKSWYWRATDTNTYTGLVVTSQLLTGNGSSTGSSWRITQTWTWTHVQGAAANQGDGGDLQNYDYDIYQPFRWLRAQDVQGLADSLGMPLSWVNVGVAWHQTTRAMIQPSRINLPPQGGVWTNAFTIFWPDNPANYLLPPNGTGNPNAQPGGAPPASVTFDLIEPRSILRLEPAANLSELGWIGQNLGVDVRWGNEAFIWQTKGHQKDGSYINGFDGTAGLWVQGYPAPTLDRDAQVQQSFGVWALTSHPGLAPDSPKFLYAGTWWANYTENAIYVPAEAGRTSVPYTTFTTASGGSGFVSSGANVVTAPQGTASAIRLVSPLYVDLLAV